MPRPSLPLPAGTAALGFLGNRKLHSCRSQQIFICSFIFLFLRQNGVIPIELFPSHRSHPVRPRF